jgi:aspartate kinase
MLRKIRVFTMDGSSVRDAGSIRTICSVIEKYNRQPVLLLCSALGDMKRLLEKITEAHAEGSKSVTDLFEQFRNFHLLILKDLFTESNEVYDLLNDSFVEIEWILEDDPHPDYDFSYDQIVSMGSVISTQILHAFLNHFEINASWLDVRDVIRTDNTYRNGNIDRVVSRDRIQIALHPLIDSSGLVVTQGSIGGTSENYTTTLGNKGIDKSASIFAHSLEVESIFNLKGTGEIVLVQKETVK